jgi:hypothetical protein
VLLQSFLPVIFDIFSGETPIIYGKCPVKPKTEKKRLCRAKALEKLFHDS